MDTSIEINQKNCFFSLNGDKQSLYLACLNEFKALDYNDPYLDEIRRELANLTNRADAK